MEVQALLAPDAGPPLGQSRARVLDLLRAAGSPLDVRQVLTWLTIKDSQLAHRCELRVPGFW
jgi:hypothetical protein